MMRKVVLAPDSFKGTMTAREVCEIWNNSVKKFFPQAETVLLPMADGGEGMVDACMKIFGGEYVKCTVSDPMGKPIEVSYGLLPDGTGVMEMAACAGLPLMNGNPDVLHATTFGVGEMVADAEKRGIQNIIMGIGGSATNDCGIGMAKALGYSFLSKGVEIEPTAFNMSAIDKIVLPNKLPKVKITVACDVDNPICGKNGATYIFGGQKGADRAAMAFLDSGLSNMAELIRRDLNIDVSTLRGGGAAGGLGAGLYAFLGCELKKGIDLILDWAHFDEIIEDADLVITGEGRLDGQSVHGKVPYGIGIRAKNMGVPCIALCGSLGSGAELVYDCGITAVYSAVNALSDFEGIKATCREDMRILADSVMRTLTLTLKL